MYGQKICYIDLYRNGVKCGNMGHVRLEWDQDRYRFTVSLCHMDRQTLVTAVMERTGGRPRTTIQNIAIIHGKGNAQFDWMALEGDEESLLFQASGEVYGVCRLPRMRAETGKDETVRYEVRPERPEQEEAEQKQQRQERAERKQQRQERVEPEQKQSGQEEAGPERQGQELADWQQPDQKMPGQEQSGLEQAIQEQPTQSRITPEAVIMPAAEKTESGALQDDAASAAVYPQNMEERRKRERRVTTLSDDKWKQLCNIYPTVHPIGDDVDFVEITPADFVILRQEYQNLVRNSFLLHGYYNYNHVLLGKYPDKYYIGVPGIMHEQERIAAAMFGFVGFERAEAPEEQKENRDQFGYYMMEVGI